MPYDEEEELLRRIEEKLQALDAIFQSNKRNIEEMRKKVQELELLVLMDEIYEYLDKN